MKTTNLYTLTLILLLATSNLLWIESASAQSIPKPSTPEFTLNYVKDPYDVAPVYTTDPYTGKTVVSQSGYHAENKSIQVKIRNQAFTPYIDSYNHSINLYYNVRVKGHYAQDWEWKELYSPYESCTREGTYYTGQQSPMQSSGQYTTIACAADYSEDAEVDFQVQALEGYYIEYYPYLVAASGWYFNGTASDWSVIQTIKIGSGEVTVSQAQVTPSPMPVQPSPTAVATAEPTQKSTETPSKPNTQADTLIQINWEQIVLALACIAITVLAVVVMILWRRLPKRAQ